MARWSCPELARDAVTQGIVSAISASTVWRWLARETIKPWQYRSWIFPRDPDFAATAERVLEARTSAASAAMTLVVDQTLVIVSCCHGMVCAASA